MGPIEKLATVEGILSLLVAIAAAFGALAFAMTSSGSSDSSVGWAVSGGDRAGYTFAVKGTPTGDTCTEICDKAMKDSFCVVACPEGNCGGAAGVAHCGAATSDADDVCICLSRRPDDVKKKLD